MHYPTLRRTPATSLIGKLCLASSLLVAVTASPTSTALPAELSDEEKISVEIAIKSDQEVTTTITITSPASREKNLKEGCVQETFTKDSSKAPDITFSNDNGTPTCRATRTIPVSQSNTVTHDGNEYVVDTSKDSVSSGSTTDSFALTVIFPGKVTDADGGKVEGDEQNKVSFDDFRHTTRGQDTAKAASQSTAESDSKTGLMILIGALVLIAVVGGAIAVIGNANKKRREQKYLAALEQQPLHADALGAIPHSLTYPAPPQAGPAPAQPFPPQPGYSPASQPYQQGSDPAPSGAGGQYRPPNQNGYSSY